MSDNNFIPRVKLKYPEFDFHYKINEVLGWSLAYSFYDIEGEEWFLNFYDRLIEARDRKQYMPLYRMGDGEYTFLLGENIYNLRPFKGLTWKQKFFKAKIMLSKKEGHTSGTARDGKESYTEAELNILKQKFIEDLRLIASIGILGLGLDNGNFYGKYMPYIKQAFDNHSIELTPENYYHVYHVYALFASSYGDKFLRDQHILIVTALNDEKKNKFEHYLLNKGVKRVSFYSISPNKSMLDVVDISKIDQGVDIALIGAGVGSVNILRQLEPLSVPCLDIGTVLGNMLDSDRIYVRPFMANDSLFDLDKLRFVSEQQRNRLKQSNLF